MIKCYILLLALLTYGFTPKVQAQGSESFNNSNASKSYKNSSFIGDNDIQWSYEQARDQGDYFINGNGLLLKDKFSKVYTETIPNGIGDFKCSLKKAFSGQTKRQVELFINGISYGKSLSWNDDDIHTFEVKAINTMGNVIIEIQNITNYQIVIDEISWTTASDIIPDFCNITTSDATIHLSEEFIVNAQVYKHGLTDSLTPQEEHIEAWIGYSTIDNNPSKENWIWIKAENAQQINDNWEFTAEIGAALELGTYFYASRFRVHGGPYVYGGYSTEGGGFWDGTTSKSGRLEVQAAILLIKGNIGNFPIIPNGSTNTMPTNNTQYASQNIGNSQTKSFKLFNNGNKVLHLDEIIISGDADDFIITQQPDHLINPGEESLLEIEFSPTGVGSRNAVVSIYSDDTYNSIYTFTLSGTGLCQLNYITAMPNNGPAGTVVTLKGDSFDADTQANINGENMLTKFVDAETLEVVIPITAYSGQIVITNTLGCTFIASFTVQTDKIAACISSEYANDLFISEITDATFGGLTYIEIFNGTGIQQNVQNYSIDLYFNGKSTPFRSIQLKDHLLLHGETFVLALGAGALSNKNFCPQEGGSGELADQTSTSPGINKKLNEHDMIRLLKNGELVDEFGVFENETWMDSTHITGDNGFNFRRKTSSPSPNPLFNLNDWEIIDWTGSGMYSCSTNDYSNIGKYDYSKGKVPQITQQPQNPESVCSLSAVFKVENEIPANNQIIDYQWFYNIPNTSIWTEILNTDSNFTGQNTSELIILNILDIEGYQFHARVLYNENCYSISQSVKINLDVTYWDGLSWSNGTPDLHTTAVLESDYFTSVENESFSACNLVILSGAELTVGDNHYVEVANNVIVDGNDLTDYGSIVVESFGSFIQLNDIESDGFKLNNTAKGTVYKTTALKTNWYDYTYWGSPVTSATVEAVFSLTPADRRFYFEPPSPSDISQEGNWKSASGSMIPGLGYAMTSGKSGEFPRYDYIAFQGQFNNGPITIPVSNNNIPDENNWNLVSNPYPSAIDFHELYSSNSDIIEGTAYLWCHTSPPHSDNPGSDHLNFNTEDYAIISVGSGNVAVRKDQNITNYISSAQGFFVLGKNNGGLLKFKNAMRHGGAFNTAFYREIANSDSNKLWLNLSSKDGVFSQILIAYVNGATDGFDGYTYEAERKLSAGVNAYLYTKIPETTKKFAIQGRALSSLNSNERLDLGFSTAITEPTTYTLSIAKVQGLFFDDNPVILTDRLLNLKHNLSTSDYDFTSFKGDFNDRFEISFDNHSLSNATLAKENINIFEVSPEHYQIKVANSWEIQSVEILDLTGRTLLHFNSNTSDNGYHFKNLSQTAYILKVNLTNGQNVSKLIILK